MTSIIIFSSNNKTKLISKTISDKTGADLIEIKDLNRKKGFFNNLRSNINAVRSNKTKIEPEKLELEIYDLILLGCPSTLGGLSPAINTFISRNEFYEKNIIIYTTTNTRQGYEVLRQMKQKLERKGGHVINSFIMRVNNKSDEELRINTIKLIKKLDIDLYS